MGTTTRMPVALSDWLIGISGGRGVCIVTSNIAPHPKGVKTYRGGISEEQHELCLDLRSKGIVCNVISLSMYGKSPTVHGTHRVANYHPYSESAARKMLFPLLELFRPIIFLRVLKLLKEHRPSVVEIGETRQLSLAPILAALVLGISVVIRNDWICPSYPREIACTDKERLQGCGHCLEAPSFAKPIVGLSSFMLYKIKRNIWNRCFVAAQSEYQVQLFLDWGIDDDTIIMAPPSSSIGHDDEFTNEILKIKGDKKAVLYVGRLTKEKGFGSLLIAMGSLHPHYKLIVAGDGPERKEQCGVHYLGWVEKHKLGSAYLASDVLVVPTLVPESHPVVVDEALKYGLPVVVTPMGAQKELANYSEKVTVSKSTCPNDIANGIRKATEHE